MRNKTKKNAQVVKRRETDWQFQAKLKLYYGSKLSYIIDFHQFCTTTLQPDGTTTIDVEHYGNIWMVWKFNLREVIVKPI